MKLSNMCTNNLIVNFIAITKVILIKRIRAIFFAYIFIFYFCIISDANAKVLIKYLLPKISFIYLNSN